MLTLIISIPAFARMYGFSCQTCHYSYPKLNPFGEQFIEKGYYLEGNDEKIYQNVGDEKLNLFEKFPIAIRFNQLFEAKIQADSQHYQFLTPNFAKIFSGGPISKNLNFYTYLIIEEGEAPKFEDAWINLHNEKLAFTIGQFQISDLMFMRELRLTISDYYIYKFSDWPLTYHRGALFEAPFISFGIVNGNGLNFEDNNNQKLYFSRLELFKFGIFGLYGEDFDSLNNYINIRRAGLDFRYSYLNAHFFGQLLYGKDYDEFYGGFIGLDYILFPKVLSILMNYITAPNSSVYYSQRLFTTALNFSYYIRTNAKMFFEFEGEYINKNYNIKGGIDYAF